MTTGNINYSAVLADLEARKEELESAIAAVRSIVAAGGGSGSGALDGGLYNPDSIPVGTFLRLSIADATKKFLDMVKSKQNVPTIIRALERGGLPPINYQTIYAVLRRRESQVGDIIRLGDEWALAEWYPNNPNLRKRTVEKKTKGKAKSAKKTPAAKKKAAVPKKPSPKPAPKAAAVAAKTDDPPRAPSTDTSFVPTLTVPDMAASILASGPLDTKIIAERLKADFGKTVGAGFLKPLLGRDKKHRFENIADNVWGLKEK